MRKETFSWYSHRIGKEMPIAVYGHYGFPLLMFPTAAADFEEYERFHLLAVMKPWIDAGKVKVYSIDSINSAASSLPQGLGNVDRSPSAIASICRVTSRIPPRVTK